MAFASDKARLEREWGIVTLAQDYLPDDLRNNFAYAMDAQPSLVTTSSAGIPSWMTTYVDPEIVRVLQAPNEGASILGEEKKGTWVTTTAMFPVVENTGEIASYGDRNPNGRSGANATFPQRQSYHFQTVIEYGDREVDMAGEARLNWVSELQQSAASTLNKFMDYTYHFGVSGLQNYGILNDSALPSAVTPVTKVATGGTSWGTTGSYASPNEIFNDFQIMFYDLTTRTYGRVKETDSLIFACSPSRKAALMSQNAFGKSAMKMIKEMFMNIKVVSAPRFTVSGVENAKLISDKYDGKSTGTCAFTEKMRDHRIIPDLSSFKQKKTAGTWGAILKYPIAITSITGI